MKSVKVSVQRLVIGKPIGKLNGKPIVVESAIKRIARRVLNKFIKWP